MDNSIKPGLLNDTYNLVQLARESALAQGRQAQADKLSPVVDHLKTLVSNNQTGSKPVQGSLSAAKTTNSVPATASGVVGQSDFQALLNAAKSVQSTQRTVNSSNIAERNQMVRSMAAGNMMDVDIARSLGMTREEVKLVLSVGK
jgi:hypothetical protein